VQKKLNNHVIHGQIIKVRPFHPKVNIDAALEAKFSINDTLKRSLTNSDLDEMKGQAKRNNRLIIRNLSFKATEDDLKVCLLNIKVSGVQMREKFIIPPQ
jgi:exosome complex RNA-binding protein Rrp4